jgi:SPP1 gp7 family putative phage head morphogenesis protein
MRVNAPVEDVARDINESLGKVRARAGRIAENELDNAVKAMTDARMAEAELDEAVWRHYTPRERARPHHLARQGKRFSVDDPVWQELYAPYCRCQKRPVLTAKK